MRALILIAALAAVVSAKADKELAYFFPASSTPTTAGKTHSEYSTLTGSAKTSLTKHVWPMNPTDKVTGDVAGALDQFGEQVTYMKKILSGGDSSELARALSTAYKALELGGSDGKTPIGKTPADQGFEGIPVSNLAFATGLTYDLTKGAAVLCPPIWDACEDALDAYFRLSVNSVGSSNVSGKAALFGGSVKSGSPPPAPPAVARAKSPNDQGSCVNAMEEALLLTGNFCRQWLQDTKKLKAEDDGGATKFVTVV